MAYRVEFLPGARSDLERICRRLILEAPIRGSEWLDGLERSIQSLGNLPERCPVIGRLSTSNDLVRRLLYGRYPHIYKIYYHLVSETVEIMHIRHGARKEPRRRDVLGR